GIGVHRAGVGADKGFADHLIRRVVVVGKVVVVQLVEVVLLDVRQNGDEPAGVVNVTRRGSPRLVAHGETAVLVVVIHHGQANLLEIVLALRPAGGLAHLLHGRHEQTDQHGNDGNHHQQLDQGKGRTVAAILRG